MVHLKRARGSAWLLGACAVSSAVQGGSGYLFPATAGTSLPTADRSVRFLRQPDSFLVRGDGDDGNAVAAAAAWHGGAVVALSAVAPKRARRQDSSLSMKQKQKHARRKASRIRMRRAGPRTDVEGYSHAAFRE